jgi:hypothetical protein
LEASAAEVGQGFTVTLVSKAATDLVRTCERSRLTETDIVNRAISLYGFIDQELDTGAELLLRRHDGSTHVVQLF